MSFILDALKKSEAERQRQTGPTLYEMRAAPRRTSLPTWVFVVFAALAVNLLVLGYLLLRKPQAPTATTAATPAAAAVTPPAAPTSQARAATADTPPPVVQGPFRAPAQAPLPETAAATPESTPATATPAARTAPATTASRPADSGAVSSLADMRTSGGSLPDLRLSLHVYDADPARRYLLLNGLRLREGDVMPDGLRVERITEDGAIMGWRGHRFLLPRGE